MEFRILGPLEVVDRGEPVPVGGPKPRALLAALLLTPGTVVSTDRLVIAVWGADPPRDAVGALRAYVSRLRAVLPERLRWRAPGYALDVADGELDAAEFHRLTGLARERAAVGDHRAAVDLLDTALGLWRGEPLDEFDAADIDRDGRLAHLADLRLAAVEERAAGLLALGRGRAVVGELAALVERHPDRETLAALLMHALYASGRQADALAVYQDLRRRLVEELGVEPSDATRALHRRVLEQDPTLAPVETDRPTNLPRRGTALVGREQAIDAVAEALRSAPLVTLVGVGGVGKTRLAIEVAGRERDRFADGAWLAELAPLADGGSVAPAVAAALQMQQRHATTIEQTVVEYFATRSLLLVLDNCEHVLDAAARLVQRIVAECPGVVVLATSREPLGVDGEQVWPVPPLPPPDAATLFVLRARATRPDFDPDGGAVAEICRRLDGLPLGIELAAARTRAMSAAEIAERLDDGHLLARAARTAQPRHQSLAAAIDWSYRLLDEPEQRLFARMSVFAGGADLAARARRLRRARHVAVRHRSTRWPRWWTSPWSWRSSTRASPVTACWRPCAPTPGSGRRRRSLGGTPSTSSASPRRPPAGCRASTSARGSRRRCRTSDNLRAAFELAFAERDVDLALRLVAALPELTHVRGMYEADEWAQRSLDLADPGHPLFAAAVGTAARGAWGVGDFARADALAALAPGCLLGAGAGRSGHPADVAADVALYRGDVAAAEAHYTSEVERARREGDRIRLVWTLYYVAICRAVRRVPEAGVAAAQEALAVARETGNPTRALDGPLRAGAGPQEVATRTRRWPSWTRRRGSRRRCRTSGGRASR